MAGVIAFGFVLINAIGSLAGYINSYFNENVAQHVANDLRRKIYHHLQHLSLSYYDTHQTGKLLSTITADVSTIQDFDFFNPSYDSGRCNDYFRYAGFDVLSGCRFYLCCAGRDTFFASFCLPV